MKYFVRIGETQHEVVLDGETVTLDGKELRAHIEDIPGTPLQMLSVGNERFRMLARRGAARGSYDVSIEGHRLSIEALDERARVIRELSGASKARAGAANLMAPMPGLIVRITVKEGDAVRAGQGLVVMEAMKMENELRASVNATVKRVAVTAGSAVEKGALLLELE
jgi:acetyl/propionyl-CoA carboxylase alpha subunit